MTASAVAPADGAQAPSPQRVRMFVGIRIATDIARQLAEFARPLASDGARIVPGADIHLTLVPPWTESRCAEAIETLRTASAACQAFWLTFAHLRYGPTLRYPRLLWVECAAADELRHLQRALMTAYGQTDTRPFQPHVTVARLPSNGRTVARRHPIDQALTIAQWVSSVELFRSPSQGERGYRILASAPLRSEPEVLPSPGP